VELQLCRLPPVTRNLEKSGESALPHMERLVLNVFDIVLEMPTLSCLRHQAKIRFWTCPSLYVVFRILPVNHCRCFHRLGHCCHCQHQSSYIIYLIPSLGDGFETLVDLLRSSFPSFAFHLILELCYVHPHLQCSSWHTGVVHRITSASVLYAWPLCVILVIYSDVSDVFNVPGICN
jgi:hypothetical protein